MTCRVCGCAMLPNRQHRTLPTDERRKVRSHRGRGLCSRCYRRSEKDGSLIDHEPILNKRDVLIDRALDEVDVHGLRYADLPAALGVTREALTAAVRRGVRAGDEQAARLFRLNTYTKEHP